MKLKITMSISESETTFDSESSFINCSDNYIVVIHRAQTFTLNDFTLYISFNKISF